LVECDTAAALNRHFRRAPESGARAALTGDAGAGPSAAAHETLGGAVEIAEGAGALGPAVRDAAFGAFTAGMHWTAVVMTVLVALAGLTVARVLRPATR
jgi:hypothetical protein